LSNELPPLRDVSGALAGRFSVLALTQSFFGNEDLGLTDELLTELPGILIWALAGWKRLRQRGHFLQPPSSKALIEELEELGSPFLAFVRQRCELKAGYTVGVENLYAAWKAWCTSNDHPGGTPQSFGRGLRAVLPNLEITQPRMNRMRMRWYKGIRLRPGT
jgi:putative DNA primase/helicase